MYSRDVSISCNATDGKQSEIEWKTENYKIKPNPYKYVISGNSLKIKNFHYSDVGIYTCTVESNRISQAISIRRASNH